MSYHALTDNFHSFFGELNPTLTTERAAASEYAAVKALIEDRAGLAVAPIAGQTAAAWHATTIRTSCEDQAIFTPTEWAYGSWAHFHQFISECSKYATLAATTTDRQTAIACWQHLFGDTFCPHL